MTHVCIRLTCYARAGQLVLLKSMLYWCKSHEKNIKHVCIRLTCYARAGQLVLLKSMLYWCKSHEKNIKYIATNSTLVYLHPHQYCALFLFMSNV